MKRGRTHARGDGQIFYADRFAEPSSQIVDGLDDSSLMAIRHCHGDDLVATVPGKKSRPVGSDLRAWHQVWTDCAQTGSLSITFLVAYKFGWLWGLRKSLKENRV